MLAVILVLLLAPYDWLGLTPTLCSRKLPVRFNDGFEFDDEGEAVSANAR